jgi:nucleoside-diphosphate-sugar epimerase
MADRVLVTGATGFVGSHVAQALLEAGYEVRCGARATSDLRWISGLDTERVPLDVRGKPEDISRAVENVDVVVHAAGITRARRPEDYYLVNAEGTRRIATAALRAGVRRFVLISSLAARGPDGPATGDHPESDYGRSKLKAETHLLAVGGRMEAVLLRPAAVYGPRDTDLLPLFRLANAGWLPVPWGAGPLQPLYVEDAARAALAAARELRPLPGRREQTLRLAGRRRRAREVARAYGSRRAPARGRLRACGADGRVGCETTLGGTHPRRAPGSGPGAQCLDLRRFRDRGGTGMAGGGPSVRGSGAHRPVVRAGGVA